jgi:hypothetical protein
MSSDVATLAHTFVRRLHEREERLQAREDD